MKRTVKKLSLLFVSFVGLFQLASCASEEVARVDHNPSQPVKLTTFYPDSGMYKE